MYTNRISSQQCCLLIRLISLIRNDQSGRTMGPRLISTPRPLIRKEGRIDNKMLPNERNNSFKKHNKVIWETAFEITQQTKKNAQAATWCENTILRWINCIASGACDRQGALSLDLSVSVAFPGSEGGWSRFLVSPPRFRAIQPRNTAAGAGCDRRRERGPPRRRKESLFLDRTRRVTACSLGAF